MDRREILKRELAANATFGLSSSHEIGRVGCHDIEPPVVSSPEISDEDDYYTVRTDEDGNIIIGYRDENGEWTEGPLYGKTTS